MKQGIGSKKRRMRRGILAGATMVTMVVLLLFFVGACTEKDSRWVPEYEKMDLGAILNKSSLHEEDYAVLLGQTGLGKAAVDMLMEKHPIPAQRKKVFEGYQQDFFHPLNLECSKIGIITYEERLVDEEREPHKGFRIPNLEDGDVIITKATHSLGWRHGHAALVSDAEKGETLEAILWGHPTVLQSVDKWQTYPSFMILRLKDEERDMAGEATQLAKDTLYDLPYGLLTGIPKKAPGQIKKTQCAHLVWYPYFRLGVDLDSDGSWLVTPKDIANTPHLEIVQVYGMNPQDPW